MSDVSSKWRHPVFRTSGEVGNLINEISGLVKDVKEAVKFGDKIKIWGLSVDGNHCRDIVSVDNVSSTCLDGRALIIDNFKFDPAIRILNLLRPKNQKSCLEQVNLSISGANYRCATHFDKQNIVSLQVSGEKNWLIEPQFIDKPLAYGWFDSRASSYYGNEMAPPLLDFADSIVLAAGDALHVPAGWWHSVYCKLPSVSLTLTYA